MYFAITLKALLKLTEIGYAAYALYLGVVVCPERIYLLLSFSAIAAYYSFGFAFTVKWSPTNSLTSQVEGDYK
ncbi:hypothetical protein AGMMS49957_01820 [Synergistales bacterium]|nr:hypothetical protein AGMMS49957_01820 [Synergistales bacterium]